jgi:hypothetical protein
MLLRDISCYQRAFLFLVGCMGVRVWIAIYAHSASPQVLRVMACPALLFAVASTYLYLTNGRQNAAESGGRMWWNKMRPVHAALYFMFAYYALRGETETAWKPLALDVILGFLAWVCHRVIGCNFF